MKLPTKILVAVFLVLTACSTPPKTFLPVQVTQTQPSWDGSRQDSGIIDFVDGKGFMLTDSAVRRYKSLAEKFNEEAVGLSTENGVNYLNQEGMVLFLTLNDRHIAK